MIAGICLFVAMLAAVGIGWSLRALWDEGKLRL